MVEKALIGFIGQGWIGRNYADDFEERGYEVIRYALEALYAKNKEAIKRCDIVFIAVPTPTIPSGFDRSIIEDALSLVGFNKTAVIKSTLIPGSTEELAELFPHLCILHCPEFLSKISAANDARNPDRNIVGYTDDAFIGDAKRVLSILPKAPYELVCPSHEAEIIKYTRNTFGFVKVMYFNILYDLVRESGADWQTVLEAIKADPMIANQHINPVHKGGRGAGGCCFIKDFSAFRAFCEEHQSDEARKMLEAIEVFNLFLLKKSKKDLKIIKSVFGKE